MSGRRGHYGDDDGDFQPSSRAGGRTSSKTRPSSAQATKKKPFALDVYSPPSAIASGPSKVSRSPPRQQQKASFSSSPHPPSNSRREFLKEASYRPNNNENNGEADDSGSLDKATDFLEQASYRPSSDDDGESGTNVTMRTKKRAGFVPPQGVAGGGSGTNTRQPPVKVTKTIISRPSNEKDRMSASAARRKNLQKNKSIIQDPKKLETRWIWNQQYVHKTMKKYYNTLAEHDDLLPELNEIEDYLADNSLWGNDPDQSSSTLSDSTTVGGSTASSSSLSEGAKFSHLGDIDLTSATVTATSATTQSPTEDENSEYEKLRQEQQLYYTVRDMMLGDAELSEREIAAFFQGLTLFNIKVRSLESQLKTSKATAERLKKEQEQNNMKRALVSAVSRHSITPVAHSVPRNEDGLTGTTTAAATNNVPRTRPGLKRPSLRQDGSMGNGVGISCRQLSLLKISSDPATSPQHQKLLKELEEAEKKAQKLEKQLQQAGIQIAEDIDYETAKSEVQRIAKRMGEIGSADVADSALREEYFKLEQEMEKNQTALTLTDEYIEEQESKEKEWEETNESLNREALHKLRRHMPIDIKSMSEQQLTTERTPNGKVLPRNIARKFKRTNVLQLLRTDPADIVPMHPATIENMRVTGLTLTERRALYAHLLDVGPKWNAMKADAMTERKWTWYNMMRDNFKSSLEQYNMHIKKYGPPGNHPYAKRNDPSAGGCPMIGKQCPLRADSDPDYSGDFGFTALDKYVESNVKRATVDDAEKVRMEAQALARDKRAKARSDALKAHYKGKVLQVSLANGSCESMDEALDTMESKLMEWIEKRIIDHSSNGLKDVTDETMRKEMSAFNDALNELKLSVLKFADRSGMQLTGKRDANDDKIDIRSPLEIGLCEDVIDVACKEFFVDMEDRMKELDIKDKRMKTTIDQLRDLMDELHERNLKTLKNGLNVERPSPSRKHKTRKEIKDEIMKNDKESQGGGGSERTKGNENEEQIDRDNSMASIAGRGSGGRNDLMAAIAGRGRGGSGNKSPGGGGRNDLMAAIAGRGRGGSGNKGTVGGRNDLMAAIAGRGRGGSGNKSTDGGRGDLMAAIAGRGRSSESGNRAGGGGGRSDLLASIAGRGRGSGGTKTSGGRGNFLAEITARVQTEDAA